MPRKTTNETVEQDTSDEPNESGTVAEKSGTQDNESSANMAARPRRNARKSVLISSGDYEIDLPGVPKVEEEDDEYEQNQEQIALETSKKRGRQSTIEREVVNTKKRKIAEKTNVNTKSEDIEASANEAIRDEEDEEVDLSNLRPTNAQVGGAPVLELVRPNYSNRESTPLEGTSLVDGEESYIDNALDIPPELEVNPSAKRRGRPKKIRDFDNTEQKEKSSQRRPARYLRCVSDRVVSKSVADRVGGCHVKLFEDEIDVTELGDCYATVINGCLAYLLRKERIIEILTNPVEIDMIRESGWMLEKPPRLPPLVTHKVCFAFYVDGSKLHSVKDISADDLKPWSASAGDPVIKPNVRRHPVATVGGKLQTVKGDPRQAEIHLTEYSAWLPRLLRLRKKIFYLSRDGQIYGNVLILYDYTCPGEAPSVMNLPHGNDFLRAMAITDNQSSSSNVSDADNPFDNEVVNGPKGGNFLKVRGNKVGWAQNKKLLLKYLVNDPGIFQGTGLLNKRAPVLPPMIETCGMFVYFVPAVFVANQIHHCGDGLSPWTVSQTSSPRVRSIKKGLVQDDNGIFYVTKDQWQLTGLCLVETMSVLARCPRLRKRILYVQRNSSIMIGNVCFIYEYIREGPIPTVLKLSSGTNYWPPSQNVSIDLEAKAKRELILQGEDDQFIDVEDLEVVEEEVVGNIMDDQQQPSHENENDFVEEAEDTLNGGWDAEFEDDSIMSQDCPDPFFDGARILETGHIYLTVRHKRVACSFDCVLEWIANTNVVEDRGILNYSKPMHPPLVRNMRSYAFFVAGSAIFPHDINRDDFSPWSHNGTPDNPTCYRTKVRKIGVICDEGGSQFQIKDVDYKTCPFHLVYLYSINPREPRLRKKIFYMMETESRLVVSHALIMYDYNMEGSIPRLHGSFMKRFARRSSKKAPLQMHDVENDVSDISETEKESPFIMPPQMADDGTMYLPISDSEFWNDRNRHIHFLVNKPNLLESFGCLNSRVPALPPGNAGKGAYVFFIDGLEVDSRNLTCDGLVPWSENICANPNGITRRPKSVKYPLGLNREGQLRIWRTPPSGHRSDQLEFQMHVYTATLPRCPRLKKKVVYVLKNGLQIGHAMIIYWFTEPGEMPVPLTYSASATASASASITTEDPTLRLPERIRDETRNLLANLSTPEVAKIIRERHGVHVSQTTLCAIRRKDLIAMNGIQFDDIKAELGGFGADEWNNPNSQNSHMMVQENTEEKSQMFDDNAIQVSHTEEVQVGQGSVSDAKPHRNLTIGDQMGLVQSTPSSSRQHTLTQPNFFTKSSGNIRGPQRADTLWRIAKNSFGTTSDNETFDAIWKMMLDRNEARLLQMVHQTFGVEIIAGVVDGDTLENGEIANNMIHIADNVPIDEHLVIEDVQSTNQEEVIDSEKTTEEDEVKDFIDKGEQEQGEVQQVIVTEDANDQLGEMMEVQSDSNQTANDNILQSEQNEEEIGKSENK